MEKWWEKIWWFQQEPKGEQLGFLLDFCGGDWKKEVNEIWIQTAKMGMLNNKHWWQIKLVILNQEQQEMRVWSRFGDVESLISGLSPQISWLRTVTYGFLWDFYGISMGFLLDFYWISMGFLWDFYGISMGFLWLLMGIQWLSSADPPRAQYGDLEKSRNVEISFQPAVTKYGIRYIKFKICTA